MLLFTHLRTQNVLPILNHLYKLSVEKKHSKLQNWAVKRSVWVTTLGQEWDVRNQIPLLPSRLRGPEWLVFPTSTLLIHWILDEEIANTISSAKLFIRERIQLNSKGDRIVLIYMIRFWYFFFLYRIKNILSQDGWITVSYWVACRFLYAEGKMTTFSQYW